MLKNILLISNLFIRAGFDIKQTNDDGYIIVGSHQTFDLSYYEYERIILIKTNENGTEQWTQTFGGEGYRDTGFAVQQTTDGGYIIVGSRSDYGDEEEISLVYLIKTDSEGTLSSSFTIPTPSPKKLDKVVDALGREVNHTTNQILFHIYDDGSVEKKFIVE